MISTVNNTTKNRYAIAKHHAWAGSVLLAILGALRWFTTDSDYPNIDLYFIVAGILIISYILVALMFTYRFRSELSQNKISFSQQEKNEKMISSKESAQGLSAEEQAKIEKKTAKTESKRLKKMAKAKEKEEKKSS